MIVLVVSLIRRGISLLNNVDYLVDHEYMASWLPWAIIACSAISVVGIVLIYFYKKIGVYITVGALFLQLVFQAAGVYDPEDEGMIYTIFPLFVFIGYGLAIIIPIWDKFK